MARASLLQGPEPPPSCANEGGDLGRDFAVDRAADSLIRSIDTVTVLHRLLGNGLFSRRDVGTFANMRVDKSAKGGGGSADGDEDAGGADPLGDRIVRLLKSASLDRICGAFAHVVESTLKEREHLIPSFKSATQFEDGETTWIDGDPSSDDDSDSDAGSGSRLSRLVQAYHLPLPVGVSRDDFVASCDRRAAVAASNLAWGDDATVSFPLSAEEVAAATASCGKAARGIEEGPPANLLLPSALPALDGRGVRLVVTGDLLVDVVRS